MDDQACPRCKTTKYRNPSLKLMVNVCGHSLCENCVELLFVRGTGACAECGTALRRNNFRVQMFEDAVVEKEVDIRRRIMRDFNKKEDDFAHLTEYNDYLEMVENIIYNLVNNENVEETRKQIEAYKRDNHDLIKKNRLKQSGDAALLDKLIVEEIKQHELSEQAELEFRNEKINEKRRYQNSVVDDLIRSDLPAESILETHRKRLLDSELDKFSQPRAPVTFSSGITAGNWSKPSISAEESLFVYKPPYYVIGGPEPPSLEIIISSGYCKKLRESTPAEIGGGFTTALSCQRALRDAFCGLTFSSHDDMDVL